MSTKVSDLISKYVDPVEPVGPFGDLVQMTVKYPEEIKIMLDTLAFHFGVKKSPLLNDLVITAIQEAWEIAEKHMHPDLLYQHGQDVEKMVNEGISKTQLGGS